ncbi:hypothetical protein N7520_009517 [Penicillium odoratum]|uniref:uncharacterized protein n=1 Tax=Penicillium odoratum TaxID=1167516 RepID=UPI002548FF9B|nr:uncharacterized protein N7520_009517 [Penicillium odoratum]KAJ5752600.1 hypothetical protein N7520_009517 [Penicillium odoratum]
MPEYDSGPHLLRDVWALTAVAILVVILRFVAKLRVGKFGPDDLLMGFALCLATVGSVMTTIGIQHGFGQEVDDISTVNVPKVIMYDYLAQTFALAGGALGRVSFIVFVIGLLVSRQWHRVVFWGLVAMQLIVNSMFIIILFVQCPEHASAIWEHSEKSKCWNTRVQAYYGYFQGAFNSATDLYLAVFSTCIFWTLNLKLRVKLGLVTLLGLGVFAMVAAIIRTVQTRVLASYDMDPTIATIDYDRWLYIETYLVIITASVPFLRSLVRSMKSPSTSRNTHELSSPYVASSSAHTARTRKRDSSIDGKRIINDSGNLSNDAFYDGHDDVHDSRYSRESVIICV